MENLDKAVKRLGLILAVQAEIEGMKAHNQQRAVTSGSIGYNEANFQHMAEQIRIITHKHEDEL